jgi:hypothetical protein
MHSSRNNDDNYQYQAIFLLSLISLEVLRWNCLYDIKQLTENSKEFITVEKNVSCIYIS